MRFFDPTHDDSDEKGFRYMKKSYGRSLLTRELLLEAFRLFFSVGSGQPVNDESNLAAGTGSDTKGESISERHAIPAPKLRTRTISNLIVQLRPLRRWFEDNKSIRFYGSSLLIVYEGDASGNNADMANVRMIDFGRVRRETGGDQGYITGLSVLKNIFADLLKVEELGTIRDTL